MAVKDLVDKLNIPTSPIETPIRLPQPRLRVMRPSTRSYDAEALEKLGRSVGVLPRQITPGLASTQDNLAKEAVDVYHQGSEAQKKFAHEHPLYRAIITRAFSEETGRNWTPSLYAQLDIDARNAGANHPNDPTQVAQIMLGAIDKIVAGVMPLQKDPDSKEDLKQKDQPAGAGLQLDEDGQNVARRELRKRLPALLHVAAETGRKVQKGRISEDLAGTVQAAASKSFQRMSIDNEGNAVVEGDFRESIEKAMKKARDLASMSGVIFTAGELGMIIRDALDMENRKLSINDPKLAALEATIHAFIFSDGSQEGLDTGE